MNRVGAILYAAAIGVSTLLLVRESLGGATWLFEDQPAPYPVLGITGLMISTFGPLALSVGVWLLAPRLKARWLVHLLFIPAAIVIFREGASLFFYGVGASGDTSPEEAAASLGLLYLLVTLIVHAIALIREGYKMASQWASAR